MKWNNSSVTNETSVQQHDVETELTTMMRYTFGSIAVLSFFGNLLLCVVICRRRKLLEKTYNILMLNLAVTDMLTGVYNCALNFMQRRFYIKMLLTFR